MPSASRFKDYKVDYKMASKAYSSGKAPSLETTLRWTIVADDSPQATAPIITAKATSSRYCLSLLLPKTKLA
jgi:hypothetical protein